MTYDPLRELAAVALVGIVPCVVVVAAATPVKDGKELIAYARANKGKLSFSSSGIGNPQQLAGELMNHMAGTDVLHVPYRGAAPAVTDVATGAVTMSFTSLAAALPLMQDGKLRAVAVTSRERMPQLPDVAPLAEAGPELKDYELLNWFGLFATAGTPEPAIARLNEVVNDGLRDRRSPRLLRGAGHRAAPDERGRLSRPSCAPRPRSSARSSSRRTSRRRTNSAHARECGHPVLGPRVPAFAGTSGIRVGHSHAHPSRHRGPCFLALLFGSAAPGAARDRAPRRGAARPAGHRRGACAPSARRGGPAPAFRSSRPTTAITTTPRRAPCGSRRRTTTAARSRRPRSRRMRSRTRCSTRAASRPLRGASRWSRTSSGSSAPRA